jgi:membrane-bound lytic murein transglycosylase D
MRLAAAIGLVCISALAHAKPASTRPKPEAIVLRRQEAAKPGQWAGQGPKPEVKAEAHADEPGTVPLAMDVATASKLQRGDLPVRFSARVLRYLSFYRDDPHGKALLAIYHRRSGRHRDGIRAALKKRGLPEDLQWLAMVESSFDETARSPVGALGLWQFMPDTAKQYGLFADRWVDQRMNVRASTEAALDMFGDLHRRFGSWELAMAAYNMGPGALSQVVKRFNTNDYWGLSDLEGAIPWETTLYVPKIAAIALAMRNPAEFGLRNLPEDAPANVEEVSVPPGLSLSQIAKGAALADKDLAVLNPELLEKRTPPRRETILRVPSGKGAEIMQVTARFWNAGTAAQESTKDLPVRGTRPSPAPAGNKENERLFVVVPQEVFVYPGRARVFHRVLASDSLEEIAEHYHVQKSEILHWNTLDAGSHLLEGMTLQLFVAQIPLTALRERDVQVVLVGSEDFYALTDPKGRTRVRVVAKAGETLAEIAKRHEVSPSLLERINRRGRHEVLNEGTAVYVYVEPPGSAH